MVKRACNHGSSLIIPYTHEVINDRWQQWSSHRMMSPISTIWTKKNEIKKWKKSSTGCSYQAIKFICLLWDLSSWTASAICPHILQILAKSCLPERAATLKFVLQVSTGLSNSVYFPPSSLEYGNNLEELHSFNDTMSSVITWIKENYLEILKMVIFPVPNVPGW